MMTIGHVTMASLLIPPESKNFMVTGHCSDDCTSKYFPKDGITIFNVLLHTHLAGKITPFVFLCNVSMNEVLSRAALLQEEK